MPRQPKPYFREAPNRWVCTINGERLTSGKTKAEAEERFRELMGNQDIYRVSRTMKVGSLRAHHLTKFVNRNEWNSTTRHGNISAVQRMLNWAVEQQYINRSPIEKLSKPTPKRRTIVYSPEQWELIRQHASGSFLDFLDFLWLTGCRPKEARTLHRRHIHNDLIIWPPDESKGESYSSCQIETRSLRYFMANAASSFASVRSQKSLLFGGKLRFLSTVKRMRPTSVQLPRRPTG